MITYYGLLSLRNKFSYSFESYDFHCEVFETRTQVPVLSLVPELFSGKPFLNFKRSLSSLPLLLIVLGRH